MPIRRGGKDATTPSSLDRRTSGRSTLRQVDAAAFCNGVRLVRRLDFFRAQAASTLGELARMCAHGVHERKISAHLFK